MSVVIQAHDVWKHYRLGQIGRGTLQRDIESWWARLRGKEDPNYRYARGQATPARLTGGEDFWALRGISFEIKAGECVGIIGRNGAGKSTLLKVLSRVTAPTRGEIRVKGRIASLLEVGTGFHPDLTGRENVFLNGAILGMNKAEIARKLDSIVDFSGCSDFIDTPVKRYSSGMQVRLAFAVAAHLDAEILVVDEVLAVGDADFQKKCLGKMNDLAGSGRTVLFVSHNMGLITSLCQRAILLHDGQVIEDGEAARVVVSYYTSGRSTPFDVDFTKGRPISKHGATLLSAQVIGPSGQPVDSVDITDPCQIRMRYRVDEVPAVPFFPGFDFYDEHGNCAFNTFALVSEVPSHPGIFEASCHIPPDFLNDGTYFITLSLCSIDTTLKVAFQEKDALCLHMRDPMERTLDAKRNRWAGPIPGAVRPSLPWTITPIS